MLRWTLLLVALLAPGCASIVSYGEHPIQFLVMPRDARLLVVNEYGLRFHDGPAPLKPVVLPVMSGPYDGAKYTITASADGYLPEVRIMDTRLNPWTWYSIGFPIPILGHVLFDPTMGGRWTFRQSDFVHIIQLERLPAEPRP